MNFKGILSLWILSLSKGVYPHFPFTRVKTIFLIADSDVFTRFVMDMTARKIIMINQSHHHHHQILKVKKSREILSFRIVIESEKSRLFSGFSNLKSWNKSRIFRLPNYDQIWKKSTIFQKKWTILSLSKNSWNLRKVE